MKLSVLIPMYNAVEFINYCLDSLINQDLPKNEYEILIMNDESTDNSLEIVKKYTDKHENISVYSQKNSGGGMARQNLLKYAKGEYIYYVDSDDYIAYNSLRKLTDIAFSNDLEILGFKLKETLSMEDTEFKTKSIHDEVTIKTGLDFIRDHRDLRHENVWFIIRKSFIKEHNITFDKKHENRCFGDIMYTLTSLRHAIRMGYYPEYVYRYVQTPNSEMRTKDPSNLKPFTTKMCVMIRHKSVFINELKENEFNDKDQVIDNLTFRRDKFTFFTLLKMIRAKYDNKLFKEKISELEKVEAYPFDNFIGKEYNSMKHKILNFIVNKKQLLIVVLAFRNLLAFKNQSN